MPNIANEELGRRIFAIRREKSVEEAQEKIRRNLGTDWDTITAEDIVRLNRILGEIWVAIERNIWQQYAFDRLKKQDVERIIGLENDLNLNRKSITDIIAEFDALMTSI